MPAKRHPISRAVTRALQMLRGEAGSGVLLIAVATAAMVLANSPLAEGYHALFHAPLPWTPLAKLDTLHLWINDAAMAVFFFVVGLEIKREVLIGELSHPNQRRLPVVAALAGMAVPALIYFAFCHDNADLGRGWAIPTATDIAFAVGVISLVGRGLPPSLRMFLLTVAIVDDLLAVVVIALFYTATLKLSWLALAAVVMGLMVMLGRRGVTRAWPFALLAVALWYAVLNSGVHATIAGVLAALAIPIRLDRHGDSLLLRLEHLLAPFSGFVIVPLFGFANAGVALGGLAGQAIDWNLPLGIGLGLFAGKQIGITGALILAPRLGLGALPVGATKGQLWGLSLLCGIGFTMSLFIAQLAFPAHPLLVEEAKLGILAGSLASALMGYAVLAASRRG